MSQVFLELGLRQDNTFMGSHLGGDPFIFSLVVPAEHIATLNIPTAATDGKRYYWNPNWIIKTSLLGIRLAQFHEAVHGYYLHPTRRGTRDPQLWNHCIDYIANGLVFEDLLVRLKSEKAASQSFISGLGNYLTLAQYIEHLKDPGKPVKGMEHFVPEPFIAIKPDEDRELTEDEKKSIAKQQTLRFKILFMDPHLEEDMKRPEKIYDLLLQYVPKCPECGKLGTIPQKAPPSPGKGDKGKGSGNDPSGNSSDQGNSPSKSGKSCGTCASGRNIFDLGTPDDHLDSTEDPAETAKRLSDAMETARLLSGKIPSGLEIELGILTAPRVKWQDVIRSKLNRVRDGGTRNDYSRFRTRPLFAGMMIPKKISGYATFGCLLDSSGSMLKNDMAFGLSQLISLSERSEGWIVSCDAQCYWEKKTKIRNCNIAELSQIKPLGSGGTVLHQFFDDYQKHLGKVDFLIVITDGQLLKDDIAKMIDPKIPVFWVITSATAFSAPFGKVFELRS